MLLILHQQQCKILISTYQLISAYPTFVRNQDGTLFLNLFVTVINLY